MEDTCNCSLASNKRLATRTGIKTIILSDKNKGTLGVEKGSLKITKSNQNLRFGINNCSINSVINLVENVVIRTSEDEIVIP